MPRKRLQINFIILVLTAALSLTFAQPVQANISTAPVITVSANPEITNWIHNQYKFIEYGLKASDFEYVNINTITSGFYTQSNVYIESYLSQTGVDISLDSTYEYSWFEFAYLPDDVVENARALGEYAILFKSTFEGISYTTGNPFSVEASVLVILPPAPFSKVSPADYSLLQPTSISLNWNSSLGVYNSEYCIDTVKNSRCDSKWVGTYDFSKALTHLTPNTTYYWQVRALNYLGGITYADEGAWWSFRTKINYPILSAPTIPSPRNNSPTNVSTPTLVWGRVVHARSYEIEVALDNGFSQVVKDELVDIPSFTISPALGDGKYYWRVRTLNGSLQAGIFSKTQSFTIDTTGPSLPILNSPADNTSLRHSSTFKWNAVSTAVAYQFQYDNNANFSSPAYTAIGHGNFRRPPILPLGTFYWHVRAKDAAGNWGDWSAPFTINITGH